MLENIKLFRRWREELAARLTPTTADKRELMERLRRMRPTGGHWSDRTLEMIEGVLSMSEWKIRDVMIPKNDIVGLSANDDYRRAVALACDSGHSRYPIFDGDGDRVCGVLLAKDLLKFAAEPETFRMRRVMRPPVFEPESKNLQSMLDDFRRRRAHMVIVVDEYQMPTGVVTIEDVLERIVGEIEDEYDDEEDKTRHAADDGGVIIKGSMSVEEFNAEFNASLEDTGADTVAGWLAAALGRLPEKNCVHQSGGFVFRVLKSDDRRVYALKISRIPGSQT